MRAIAIRFMETHGATEIVRQQCQAARDKGARVAGWMFSARWETPTRSPATRRQWVADALNDAPAPAQETRARSAVRAKSPRPIPRYAPRYFDIRLRSCVAGLFADSELKPEPAPPNARASALRIGVRSQEHPFQIHGGPNLIAEAKAREQIVVRSRVPAWIHVA